MKRSIAGLSGEMAAFADDKVTDGWLPWFREQHPHLYRKFAEAQEHVMALWGKKTEREMADFKVAVKMEMDATKWAVGKYQECAQMQEEPAGVEMHEQKSPSGRAEAVVLQWEEVEAVTI